MLEEQASDLPPWNDVVSGIKSRRYTPKPESELALPGLKEIESINGRSATAVIYRKLRLLKMSFCYDDDVL